MVLGDDQMPVRRSNVDTPGPPARKSLLPRLLFKISASKLRVRAEICMTTKTEAGKDAGSAWTICLMTPMLPAEPPTVTTSRTGISYD